MKKIKNYMDFQMLIDYGLSEIIGENEDINLWEKVIRDCWGKGKPERRTHFIIIEEIEDNVVPEKEIFYAKRKLGFVVKLLKQNARKSTKINKIIKLFDEEDILYESALTKVKDVNIRKLMVYGIRWQSILQ